MSEPLPVSPSPLPPPPFPSPEDLPVWPPSDPTRPPRPKRSAGLSQVSLFCRCGELPTVGGSCRACYHRAWRSEAHFGGNRARALSRDGHKCRACGAERKPVVHHRRPGENGTRLLITLCAACHARVHRLAALRVWLPPFVVALWEEQHSGAPRQLQFDLAGTA